MKKANKKFLTVYTASLSRISGTNNSHLVLGSFLRRGDAIRACADSVVDAIKADDDLYQRIELLLTENLTAPSMEEIVAKVVDEIGGQGCWSVQYPFHGGWETFRVDVDENDVECKGGLQLWTCIVSGRDDENHDTDYEEPRPVLFLSRDEAEEFALDHLRQHLDGYEEDEAKAIMKEAEERLSECDHFEFDLNDMVQRRWDIWSTPLDLGQGAGEPQKD